MARNEPHKAENEPRKNQLPSQVAMIATAVTIVGSLMILSGLTLAASVIGLVTATPLLAICSPVLVPAAIAVFLIVAGFVASGWFGSGAAFAICWIYRYAAGKQPIGARKLATVSKQIIPITGR